jgi:hypothetical protein
MKVEVEVKKPEQDLDAVKFRMNQEWKTDLFSSCENMEQIREVFRELVLDSQEKHNPTPTGTAPLNPSVGGEPIRRSRGSGINQGFTTFPELVQYLRETEKHIESDEGRAAKAALDALILRAHNEKPVTDDMVLVTPLKEALRDPSRAVWRKPKPNELADKSEKQSQRRDV